MVTYSLKVYLASMNHHETKIWALLLCFFKLNERYQEPEFFVFYLFVKSLRVGLDEPIDAYFTNSIYISDLNHLIYDWIFNSFYELG